MTALRQRVRDALATISSAPWRRAPWLLRRRPGVLAAVAGACAVMVAAVAAVPLFLSSVGSASLALQASERCPRDTGASVPLQLDAAGVEAPPDDPFSAVSDRLGPSNRWLSVQRAALVGPGGETFASLLARDGALEHVEVLESGSGPGVWISDRGAELTGLAVGDTALVGRSELPVAGIYRDLAGTSVDDYWCSNADLVLLEQRGGDLVAPPPIVLLDPESLALAMRGATVATAQGAWEAPLQSGITVAEATSLVPTLGCATAESDALRWCERPADADEGPYPDDLPVYEPADFVERYLRSHLPFVLARSDAIRTTVGGVIWPMAGFAALAGAGLVAAAASLWFDRRRREVTLLTVRGVTPAALGLKAVLELSISLLAGGVAGVALAYAMVVWLGPSPEVEPGAIADAALVGLAATAGAAATIQLVVARRARAHGDRATRRPWLTLLPWELVLAWATMVSYRRLGEWGIPIGRGADVTRVDLWGLLFPVLFLVTVVAVLSRVLSLAIRPLRALSARWPIALYLGVRRVARYRVAVLGLVAASAIATGVLGYASTMNRSLDATLEAKVLTYVGSDTAARMGNDQELPEDLADRSTVVHRLQPAWIVDDGDRDKVLVMGVDPDTFARAALWYPEYGDASLRDVLDQLAAPPVDGHLPAVLVGADVEGTTEVGLFRYGDARFTVDILPSVRSFPGMSKPRPTLIVATDALDDEEVGAAAREVWIRGDHDETTAALRAAGLRFEEVRRAAEVADGATFLTVSWTFGFMLSLGVAAGLLVLGGVAVYLDARRRDRILAHAFMRRMGLRRRQHRGALMVELTASVLVGCWIGLAVALVTARLAHRRLDPIPSYDPVPLLRPAGLLLTALAIGAVVLTLVAASVAQRRVDRDDPVEVLRAGV